MVKLYTNKPQIKEPFNWKGHLQGIGFILVLLFFSYHFYKSSTFSEPNAHYISDINHRYANIYQLESTIFHKSDKKIHLWIDEVKEVMLDEIYSYCNVIKGSIQKPVTSRVTHKDKPNWLMLTNRYYQVIAKTEFECNGAIF